MIPLCAKAGGALERGEWRAVGREGTHESLGEKRVRRRGRRREKRGREKGVG